jgi:hypothetical protein
MSQITEPFPIFYNDDGTPLDDGMIYAGVANQDPRQNPVQLYWDSALSVPAAQPIRTLGGRPSYQGAPASIYLSQSSYSIAVFNRFGTPVTANNNTSPFITAQEAANVAAAPVRPTILTTSHTLTLADQNSVLPMSNASAITLTIPNDSTANLIVGGYVEVHQRGAGQITFAAAGGVTLSVRGTFTKTNAQNSVAGLRKLAANLWSLTGDLV